MMTWSERKHLGQFGGKRMNERPKPGIVFLPPSPVLLLLPLLLPLPPLLYLQQSHHSYYLLAFLFATESTVNLHVWSMTHIDCMADFACNYQILQAGPPRRRG